MRQAQCQQALPYRWLGRTKLHLYFPLVLVMVVGVVTMVSLQGDLLAQSRAQRGSEQPAAATNTGGYLYYALRQSSGFVLARAPKGAEGQPLGVPQPLAKFTDGFGLAESDSIFFMQLSPDGRFLAIDGTRDHGEQVWIYDTQRMTLSLIPANVLGNFLHWLPGSHLFLYRPMLPLGPGAPMDGNGWNPGLWIVDAASGAHKNIDIHVPPAFLVDAAPSPDGTRIIYSTSAGLGMGSDTWMMRSDGSSITHLFSTQGGAQSISGLFAWSPDGKAIAYERLSDSPVPFLPAGLWVMSTDGREQRRVADTDGGHGFAPIWSPDSGKIAYVVRTNVADHRADVSAQSLQSAIAVVDVASGHSWLVATSAQTGVQINANPQWVAGGADITFTAYNPINRVLGGTPRYWSAAVEGPQVSAFVTPLSPAISHVIAIGS